MQTGTANQYEANVTALRKIHPELCQLLTSTGEVNYRTEPSRSGLLTLIFRQGNQDFYLHSKFKPEAEALKLVQNTNLNADHIIVFGLGLGYHLDLILSGKPPGTRVLLIEPHLEIIRHSLKTLDWGQLLQREDFYYCFGTDQNLLASTIQQFIDVIAFDKLEAVQLPSEVRFNETFFNSAREQIDSEIRSLLYDFKTRLAEDAVVPRNVLKNIKGLMNTRPVKALKNRFAGKPGIIVSAGPSLDRNILYLKKVRDRAVIICVDTALKPLLKRNIHPHFIITADPSYKNYLHLQGTEEQIRHFLVADTGVSTRVYDDFSRHLFSVSLGKPILAMIEENIGTIGELDAWGSVISLALSFAIYTGLDPIVFTGQDFAFTGMRNHCRNTSWEEKWLQSTRDLDLIQRKEKQSITGMAKVTETRDIYGHETLTSDRLLLYKNYLAKALTSIPGKRFINASEGGVLTEIQHQPLQQVMEEFVYGKETIDFAAVYKIPSLYNPQNKKKLLKFFKAKLNFFKKYKRRVEEAIEKLENLGTLTGDSLRQVLEDAETLKDRLYNNVQNGELVEMWSQGPIFEFLKRTRKLEKPASGFNDIYGNQLGNLFHNYFKKLLPPLSGIIESFTGGIGSLS